MRTDIPVSECRLNSSARHRYAGQVERNADRVPRNQHATIERYESTSLTTTATSPRRWRRLREAVERLTGERTALVNGSPATAPCLIDQLGNSIEGHRGTGNRGVARSLPPVWTDAVDLINDIEAAAKSWPRVLPAPNIAPAKPPTTTVQRIRALPDRRWRPQDCGRLQKITLALNGWAVDIGDLLHPPRRMSLAAPCPACGATRAYRTDSAGDRVRVPVLQVDAVRGAECLKCHASWGPGQFLFLCSVLGFDRPVGVLE